VFNGGVLACTPLAVPVVERRQHAVVPVVERKQLAVEAPVPVGKRLAVEVLVDRRLAVVVVVGRRLAVGEPVPVDRQLAVGGPVLVGRRLAEPERRRQPGVDLLELYLCSAHTAAQFLR